MAWRDNYMPATCPVCRERITNRESKGVLYFTHPECYWKEVRIGEVPTYVSRRKVKTKVLKTPNLTCLGRVEKVEVTDGCSHQCIYCYGPAEPRYFPRGLVIVRENLVEKVSKELQRRSVVKPIYLSPTSEPFQSIPKVKETTIGLVNVFAEKGLSFYFVTKGVIPKKVLDAIHGYAYVDIQITLPTMDEEKRKLTEPNSPPVKERLKNIERLVEVGKRPILRIDPLLPYLTDGDEELEELITTTINLGVRHVIGSYVGLRRVMWNYMKKYFSHFGYDDLIPRYEELFFKEGNRVCNFNLAPESHRYKKLKALAELVKKKGKGKVSYSTCLEDRLGRKLFKNLWTSEMCEPIYLPAVRKVRGKFKPIKTCLSCSSRECKTCAQLTASKALNEFF